VLSAAERADTLAGCWLAGFIPTGAKDPYALRRHSLALLRILLDAGVKVDVRELLEAALNGYATQADDEARQKAKAGLFDFITTRLEGFLAGGGLDQDVVRATLPLHGHDPVETRAWAEALSGFRTQDDFLKLAQGFKRCRNILGDDTLSGLELGDCRQRWRSGAVATSHTELPEPAEQALLTAISNALPDLDQSIDAGDRVAVLSKLSTFGPLIDNFFDSVRVNADDEGLKVARRAFLAEVQGLFAGYADFTVLAPVENLTS
jgi:glycyl-tRNA synthetase beta chain